MPVPVVLVFTILIGWPLLQLASVLAVRERRRRLRALRDRLNSNPQYQADDRALVERVTREAVGEPSFVVMPLALPVGILAAAIAELIGRGPSDEQASATKNPKSEYGKNKEKLTSLEVRLGLRTGKQTVVSDPLFSELESLSFEIGLLRWPTTSALTVLGCLPVLPIYLLAYGMRATVRAVPLGAERLVNMMRLTAFSIERRRL